MRIDDLHKRCPKCGQVKALADFYADRGNKQGVQAYCVPCFKAYQYTWQKRKVASIEAVEGASEREARRAAEDLREARALQGDDPW